MSRLTLAACLAVLVSSGQAAHALDPTCDDEVTQSGLNECAYAYWQTRDAELNDAYAGAMEVAKQWDAALPAKERGAVESLRAAQRAWIIFRDNACTTEGYAMKGGSAEPMVVYGCKEQLTAQRRDQLQNMIDIGG
jgi:uncharacterized protein YecT (DUF1311 family)